MVGSLSSATVVMSSVVATGNTAFRGGGLYSQVPLDARRLWLTGNYALDQVG